ncbi:response regulator [Candidatus Saccharibacteria bacterium]|nr:response regulator [Candidatus Saccharibacteria bacterium]MCL1962718.1 response regulator [Candidatus Saccharibacteria bacterium]
MNKQKSIAIIEDDAMISTMYCVKFEQEGFEVNVADNGIFGVEMVAQKQPDIILLDINMPEMNGIEALKRIRKTPQGAKIPVVVLTNLGKQEASQEIDHLDVTDYIIKANMTPRQVVERTKRLLGVS